MVKIKEFLEDFFIIYVGQKMFRKKKFQKIIIFAALVMTLKLQSVFIFLIIRIQSTIRSRFENCLPLYSAQNQKVVLETAQNAHKAK